MFTPAAQEEAQIHQEKLTSPIPTDVETKGRSEDEEEEEEGQSATSEGEHVLSILFSPST